MIKVWQLYEGLKRYKQNPRSKDKKRLNRMFDGIFTARDGQRRVECGAEANL